MALLLVTDQLGDGASAHRLSLFSQTRLFLTDLSPSRRLSFLWRIGFSISLVPLVEQFPHRLSFLPQTDGQTDGHTDRQVDGDTVDGHTADNETKRFQLSRMNHSLMNNSKPYHQPTTEREIDKGYEI